MAEVRSNAAIARRLTITERAVAKHTASISFLRLDLHSNLQSSEDGNRRVPAVLAHLGTWAPGHLGTWAPGHLGT